MPRESTGRSEANANNRTRQGRPSLNPGDAMEARVSQLWFWEGYYSRRGINMQRHYDSEALQVTDLDLLAFDFDPSLRRHKYIGEVKTGTGRHAPKPLDRTVWLRGLLELVEADHAELTTGVVPSPRARELAASQRITAQSVAEVEERELRVSVADVVDVGPQGPEAFLHMSHIQKHCALDPELERSFWFLRSEVWFLDPWSALKRTLGLLRTLSRRWVPAIEDADDEALRWLVAEGISIWCLNLATVVGEAARLDAKTFDRYAHERLAEGVVPAPYQRRLSEAIDKYVSGVLAHIDVPSEVRVESMGAFLPQPPSYTASLIELVRRCLAEPSCMRSLPRQVDVLIHERLVRRRHVSPLVVSRLNLADQSFGSQSRFIAVFLSTIAELPPLAERALALPAMAGREGADPAAQLHLSIDSGPSAPRPL